MWPHLDWLRPAESVKKPHSAIAKFNRCSFAKPGSCRGAVTQRLTALWDFLSLCRTRHDKIIRGPPPPHPHRHHHRSRRPAAGIGASSSRRAALTDKTFFLRGSGEEILSGCSLRDDKMDSSTAPQNL